MQNIEKLNIRPIHPEFKVIVEPAPNYAIIPDEVSDEIFEKAQKLKPLFDGQLICVKNFSPQFITTYSLSFKEYVASKHLANYPHQHHPLAVSGWILYRDKVLFGVRSENVLYFSQFLELVPSGGIDGAAVDSSNEVNYHNALISEFVEETGMDDQAIQEIRSELLVFCKESHVYDICSSIHLDPNYQINCDTSNEEYRKLFWVPIKEIKEFIEDNKTKILPTSLAILKTKILPLVD